MGRRTAWKTVRLTPRQLEILTFIRDFQRKRGYSPTMQELGDALGVSKVTIFEHLEALAAKGLIARSPHKARSLEISPRAEFPDERPTRFRLAGRIAAGRPVEAIEEPETIDLDELFACKGRERFVLQVRGDSMLGEQIREGDYVIVERRDTARDGETVVALLEDGEATLKKLYREGNRYRLQPASPFFEPIYVDRLRIQGVVVAVIRKY